MPRNKDIVYLSDIKRKDVCGDALSAFSNRFGKKATYKEILKWLKEIEQLDWLANAMGMSITWAKGFLKEGVSVNFRDDDQEGTPLHWAVTNNHPKVALFLIQQGADVNAKDIEGLTSLHDAVFNDSEEAAKVLLKNKAKVNEKDNDGTSPLALALKFNRSNITQLLKDYGAKE